MPDDRTVRLEFRFGTAQNPADHALVYNPIFTDPVFAAFLRVVNGLFNKAAVFWMNGLEYNSPIGERLLRRHAIDPFNAGTGIGKRHGSVRFDLELEHHTRQERRHFFKTLDRLLLLSLDLLQPLFVLLAAGDLYVRSGNPLGLTFKCPTDEATIISDPNPIAVAMTHAGFTLVILGVAAEMSR